MADQLTSQKYSVTPQPIDTLLHWVRSKEIAVPEIQRPFVWNATKVRNFLDSLYKGYPVGYLIVWRNPNIRTKDGAFSKGKRILIDGQQRIVSLMTALLAEPIVNKNYEKIRIRIAFNPVNEIFEVTNPAIEKDRLWISDISKLFHEEASIINIVRDYCDANPDVNQNIIEKKILKLQKIINNQVGVIELSDSLDIDTVTEIFIRVNSAGAELSQADFAMSKIAANERYQGNTLRKAIDYFCHLAVKSDFIDTIEQDKEFVQTPFYSKMKWMKDVKDDLYNPSYTDMLRVAFTSEFGRGKLQDLVALLSGRNFETRSYEEDIAEQSFSKLNNGILNFMNETHFKRVTMIIRSAGFVTNRLIGSKNALDFAFILYLLARQQGVPSNKIEGIVGKWFVMSVLTKRYSSNPETMFDQDVRQLTDYSVLKHSQNVFETELNDSFWSASLPMEMDTSSSTSPYFLVYMAAQVKMNEKGFLSKETDVRTLLNNKADIHHIFPRNYLKKQGLERGQYNQIANYALMQSEINASIGDKAPSDYFSSLKDQTNQGAIRYGSITDRNQLLENLKTNCIPENTFISLSDDYDNFLIERRKLMALKIKEYFNSL